MKLFGLLGRGHTPDVEALSALVDGDLGAAAARDLEAHIAGCEACAAELEGLRAVKSMLAALPQVEPARSFRVRLADVEAPERSVIAPAPALFRAMPALAAAAAVVFVGVLVADFSTRDGDSDRTAMSGVTADRAESLSMDDRMLQFGEDGDAATENDETAGGIAAAPDAESEAPGVVPQPSDASEPPAGDSATGGAADGAAADEYSESDAATKQAAEDTLQADFGDESDQGGGNRMGFLIVEIAAGVLAIGAAGAFLASRRSRSEG